MAVGGVRRRRGVILPAALLLLLGGTLVAASLLVIARSAVLLADGDRLLAEALARRGPVAEAEAAGTMAVPVGHGFLLLRAEVEGVGWAPWSVVWQAEPARVAAGLRAVVESGSGIVEGASGVTAAGTGEGCADLDVLPAHSTPVSPPPPPPSPALPSFPRLGPAGLDALLARAGNPVVNGSELPSGHGFVATDPGARIPGGSAGGILVTAGDLTLAGSTLFEGLVLLAGDLHLEDEARIHGAVLASGAVRLGSGARVLGCRALVEERLTDLEALSTPFPVAGGAFLGRY